jgi:hypothetical protein
MKYLLFVICLIFSAGGYAKDSMKEIMSWCEKKTTYFDHYADCVRDGYNKYGINPDDPSVKEFLSDLEEVKQGYSARQLSENQARGLAYKRYQATVGADNNAARSQRPAFTNCYSDGYGNTRCVTR